MRTRFWMILLGVLLLAACSAPVTTPTLAPASTLPLVPYSTPTPTLTPQFITPTATLTLFPTPTPTPFIYQVKDGDLYGTIAFRFGITVEELTRANPGIDPHFIGQGTRLLIPIPSPTPNPARQTPTPFPVQVQPQPACYPTGGGGLTCLLLVTNNRSEGVDNLTGMVTLVMGDGSANQTQPLVAPLNILLPGASLPLVAVFPPTVPPEVQASAQLTSVFFVSAENTRYLPVELKDATTVIAPDGISAAVSGTVTVGGSQSAEVLWVVAVAYDDQWKPLGVRKWEAPAGGAAGQAVPFTFSVYSLGGPITRVNVLAEARPAGGITPTPKP